MEQQINFNYSTIYLPGMGGTAALIIKVRLWKSKLLRNKEPKILVRVITRNKEEEEKSGKSREKD